MSKTQKLLSSSHWGAFQGNVQDGRLVGTEPFAHDPHPSPLTEGIPAAVYSPLRIDSPAVRAGWLNDRAADNRAGRGLEPFVSVSWEQALDLVAAELSRVRDEHGPQAIFGGSYGWSSAGHLHHARTLTRRFLYALGGCVDQVTNYSYGAAMMLMPHIVGTNDPISGRVTDWRAIAKHTRLMVMFGGANMKNLQIASGGSGEHASEKWLRAAKAAGMHVISVSPIRDDAPEFLGADWIALRPNSDTALMLGIAHTLVQEALHDASFLATHCVGFDRFLVYVNGTLDDTPKSAEWAARLTGVPASTIRQLARQMAATRTMLTATWSLQRAEHGEQPYWMLVTLAAMLGQIGLAGGGFAFGLGSMNSRGNPRPGVSSPRMSAGVNPLRFAIPVARIADLLLEPGATIDFDGEKLTYPDIKLVYWAGGNPFHHHQDLHRLVAAFRRPQTVIVHETCWTSTARYADIVLPATTAWERNDIGAGAADRFVIAMRKLIEPVGLARNDFDIFSDIARRLGFEQKFTEGRDEAAWLRHIYGEFRSAVQSTGIEIPDFDRFWHDGYVELPLPADDFIAFSDFRAEPRRHPLATPSGRLEIFSEVVAGYGYDDCPGHATWIAPREWLGAPQAARFPLHLISNQPSTRLHSQLDMSPVSQASKIRGREPVRLNPADAAARGIADGDLVEIFNERGSCLAGAVVTDTVMPAVVQISTGAWFDPVEPGATRSLDTQGNPNVLTADRGTSRLGQGPSPLSTLVDVRRYVHTLSEPRIHRPPELIR